MAERGAVGLIVCKQVNIITVEAAQAVACAEPDESVIVLGNRIDSIMRESFGYA